MLSVEVDSLNASCIFWKWYKLHLVFYYPQTGYHGQQAGVATTGSYIVGEIEKNYNTMFFLVFILWNVILNLCPVQFTFSYTVSIIPANCRALGKNLTQTQAYGRLRANFSRVVENIWAVTA